MSLSTLKSPFLSGTAFPDDLEDPDAVSEYGSSSDEPPVIPLINRLSFLGLPPVNEIYIFDFITEAFKILTVKRPANYLVFS